MLCLPAFFTCLAKAAGMPPPQVLSHCLSRANRQAQSTQGTPLDCLDPMARGACIPGPYGTVAIIRKAVFCRLPHPSGTHSNWNTLLVCWWKRPTHWSWSFSLRDRLQVCHIRRGYEGTLRDHSQGDTTFVFSLGLAIAHWYLPARSIYTHTWSPDFCNCHPRDTSRSPGLKASRVYNCSPVRLYIAVYFKSRCLRFWLLVSLKPCLTEIPLFGTLLGLITPLITGTYQE